VHPRLTDCWMQGVIQAKLPPIRPATALVRVARDLPSGPDTSANGPSGPCNVDPSFVRVAR
jgi:hypothetical protein